VTSTEVDVGRDAAGADPGTDLHRTDEAHLVESVVDAHQHALEPRLVGRGGTCPGRQVREHRQCQESVGDRASERSVLRPLGIDVDELVVVGDVGELADLVLGDLEPIADSLVRAHIGLEQLERSRGSLAHAADLRSATWSHQPSERR